MDKQTVSKQQATREIFRLVLRPPVNRPLPTVADHKLTELPPPNRRLETSICERELSLPCTLGNRLSHSRPV
jgi:hypothetical protein